MRALVLACLAAAGCAGPPASEQFAVASLAPSELQTRRYEDVRPQQMLPAALATLQDFGFQVTSSDMALGFIVAQRGHRKTLGEFNYEVWRGSWELMRHFYTFQWHRLPKAMKVEPASLSAAVSVAPAGSGSEVRVTLHRFATQPTGEPIVVWAEEVAEPEVYARFFDLLAQALAREQR